MLLLTNTLAHVEPPTTGKFFYVDFDGFGQWGQHAVNVSIKNKDNTFTEYPLFVSTTERALGMISDVCKDGATHGADASSCDIKTPYKSDLSGTYSGNPDADPRRAKIAVYNDKDYQTQLIDFKGYKAQENFHFSLKNYKRETTSNLPFYAVTSMAEDLGKVAFKTDFSGFMGIAPYTNDDP